MNAAEDDANTYWAQTRLGVVPPAQSSLLLSKYQKKAPNRERYVAPSSVWTDHRALNIIKDK